MVAWFKPRQPIARFCPDCESRLHDDPQIPCVFCRILNASEVEADDRDRHGIRQRPPRTGYFDDVGVYHPAPDDVMAFDVHCDICAKCRCERSRPRASGYVEAALDRSVHNAAVRRAIRMPIPLAGMPRKG